MNNQYKEISNLTNALETLAIEACDLTLVAIVNGLREEVIRLYDKAREEGDAE